MAATCPVIADEDDADIELSTYTRTVGTFVVISCKGFGRHVRDPTSVECLATGAWSETPNLECYAALDEKESIILGVSIACAVLIIVTLIVIACYCCFFRDKHRARRYRWWGRFISDEPDYKVSRKYEGDYSPRDSFRRENVYTKYHDENSYKGSIRRDYFFSKDRYENSLRDSVRKDYDFRKSRRPSLDGSYQYRRTRRYSDGDRYSIGRRNLRTTRRYSYHDELPVDYYRRRRYSDPSVHTSVYRRPERVIYREPIHLTSQPVHGYIDDVVAPPVYTEEPTVVKLEEQPIVQPVRQQIVRRIHTRYIQPQHFNGPHVYSHGLYSDVGDGVRSKVVTEPYISDLPSYSGGNLRTTRVVPAYDTVRTEPLIREAPSYYGGNLRTTRVVPAYDTVRTEPLIREVPSYYGGNLRTTRVVPAYDTVRTGSYIREVPSYYGGNLRTTRIVPAAKIVELDGGKDEIYSPIKTGHYELSTVKSSAEPNLSTNYFFGRQDYPYEDRKQELSHVLYHGNGKTTKIFEDDATIY